MGLSDTGFGWFLGLIDRRTRIGHQGSAKLCDFDHIPIAFSGEDWSRRRQPLHLDIQVDLWNKGRERVTLLSGGRAKLGGQELVQGAESFGATFEGVTLEARGAPVP